MLEACTLSTARIGICTSCHLIVTPIEPDAEGYECEECGTETVSSVLVLADMICYNPNIVPAIPADLTSTGEKEPVCADCIARANPERLKNGLPPIVIIEGAYEAADESELGGS